MTSARRSRTGLEAILEGLREHLRSHVQRSEVCRHLVAANRELLLAIRSAIDRRIQFIEHLLTEEEKEQPQAKKIPVEGSQEQ